MEYDEVIYVLPLCSDHYCAGCLMLDSDRNVVDSVQFRQLNSICGSVKHGGDARDDLGGDGDDEQIHLKMDEIPANIHYVAFCVTSFDGKPLRLIDTFSGHLFETDTKRDLVMFDCVDETIKQHTAVLLCILYRARGSWMFMNASIVSDGLELNDNLPNLQKFMDENPTMQTLTKLKDSHPDTDPAA